MLFRRLHEFDFLAEHLECAFKRIEVEKYERSAALVYAQPEEEGEAASREYRRFLPGLGITKTMLLPHYQMVKDDVLDGMKLFDEITLPDSVGRRFYAIPDGSYLLGRDGRETLYGEAWLIENGKMRQVSKENEALIIK